VPRHAFDHTRMSDTPAPIGYAFSHPPRSAFSRRGTPPTVAFQRKFKQCGNRVPLWVPRTQYLDSIAMKLGDVDSFEQAMKARHR
jgi:hypothetical protein